MRLAALLVVSSGFRQLATIMLGVITNNDQVKERETGALIREGADLIRLGPELAEEPLQEVR